MDANIRCLEKAYLEACDEFYNYYNDVEEELYDYYYNFDDDDDDADAGSDVTALGTKADGGAALVAGGQNDPGVGAAGYGQQGTVQRVQHPPGVGEYLKMYCPPEVSSMKYGRLREWGEGGGGGS